MQASRDDRIDSDRSGGRNNGRHSSQTLLISIAVIILAAGAYLLKPKDPSPPPIVEDTPEIETLQPPEPEVAPAVVAAPDIPETVEAPSAAPEAVVEPEPTPEPPTQEELDNTRQSINDLYADISQKHKEVNLKRQVRLRVFLSVYCISPL